MNNEPTPVIPPQPQPQPPRTAFSAPTRPSMSLQVPQRSMTPASQGAAGAAIDSFGNPVESTGQQPNPVPVSVPQNPPQDMPTPVQPPTVAPVSMSITPQPADTEVRKKTLQPINEAEVLRIRALADEEVKHAQPAVVTSEPAVPTDGSTLQPSQTYRGFGPTFAEKKAFIADEIERGPDNAPVPVMETTVEDFLPPVRDKDGNIDTTYEEEAISIPRLIIAGLTLPLVWMAIEYGLNWVASALVQSQAHSTTGSFDTLSVWDGLFKLLPFITIALASVGAYFILRYPHKGYRWVLSVGVILCTVGLVQLMPHIPALAGYVTNTTAVTYSLTHLNSTLLPPLFDMRTVWITLGAAIILGIIVTFALYGIIRGLRFKVPGAVVVCALIIASILPVAITIPIIAAERKAMSEKIQTLIDTPRE